MNTREILSREFSSQEFPVGMIAGDELSRYKDAARNYALLENAIAVLSDLRTHESYIYYGGFARTLGIDHSGDMGRVASIWEEEIFRLIHPDDLRDKHLQELCFYHFVKRQPRMRRADYYLMSRLRMMSATGAHIPVLHRMYYVSVGGGDAFRLALCLYSPIINEMPAKCLIVNSVNGQLTEPDRQSNAKILSRRETEVLDLINKGMRSKEIAGILSISINTVNRHRQEILGKLQVTNSIEACRTARELKLI